MEAEGTMISMDGRGRVYANIFLERLWRSVKREALSIRACFGFYNQKRLHQALGYKTPYQLYTGSHAPGGEPDPIHESQGVLFHLKKDHFLS